MIGQRIRTLLVEDDEIDAEAVIRAFQKQKIDTEVTIVPNGIEALNVMRSADARTNLAWPYLILLDINMPCMNGLEFLGILRQDNDLKRSIVFVLTTSNRDEDKLAAYNHNIAGYFVKSNVGQDYLPVTKFLEMYWQLVEFPPMSPIASSGFAEGI